jgi:hypothetical protein
MNYIYTYQTKNLINGKTYVGVHTTNRLNDGYIGCGIKSDASCRSQIKAGRNKINLSTLEVKLRKAKNGRKK